MSDVAAPRPDPVWRPTPEVVERAHLTRLMRRHGLASYAELLRRSQDEPEWFWPAVVDDLGLPLDQPFTSVVDTSRGIEWATWFEGARLNVATACVHRHASGPLADRPAVVGVREDGRRETLTFAELSRAVARLADGLAALGVRAGDRVALFLPMCPEAVVASHACAHLGAIQVPVFSGFAATAVRERLVHADAAVVVTADATTRRGKVVPLKETLDEALRAVPSVERVVVANRRGLEGCTLDRARDVLWDDAVEASPGTLEPASVEAEHPYLLAYTSGTTGRPKGSVHVHGGFLVKIAAEAAYEADLHQGDAILFATDMGWIMGPWTVVGAGALGATIVVCEGAPDAPPDRLWRLVAEERVSVLGLSPTLVRALVPHGAEIARRHDFSGLRTFVSTGEPWNPAPYRWLHEEVGDGRVPVINISGGTEVGACFLSCVHVEPVKECSLGFPALGMDVDVVGPDGEAVHGGMGELVCRRPWPGMTRGFWRERERYLDTYWRRIPGVWVHGDYASVDTDGYWFLHGRSDDTLNVAGKRVGPAELESSAVAHPAVQEAAAVGVPHDVKGEVPWLFCVVQPGAEAAEEVAAEVADRVAAELGKAFRPARVVLVTALPKTRSQKIVRRAVRAAALGGDPGDTSALENPEAIGEIEAALEAESARR